MESIDSKLEADNQDELGNLRQLVARAKQGDREVLPELRKFLDAEPTLWTAAGDLAVQAQAAWIRLVCGPDAHLELCLARKIAAMKRELWGPSPTQLEQLMVNQVISTWLQLYYHEAREAQRPENSLKWAEFESKRLQRAHDRHLKSIGAMAMLKKLLSSQAQKPGTPAPVPHGSVVTTDPVGPGEVTAVVSEARVPPATETTLAAPPIEDEPTRTNGHHHHNRLIDILTVSESEMPL